jgi:plasmid stabilization system protein ParE
MAGPVPDWHPEARLEAVEAAGWYADRSETAARDFLSELDRGLEQILRAPERWLEEPPGVRRFLLHRFPYSIVYRVRDGNVQVVAIAHAHRRPEYWKSR